MLVCAPTGAGKTVVGEFAVHLALAAGQKCFYTTPIKALSNQKYNDLVDRYGAEQVGLLTGDNSVNADAPVVVMTTEVLRNMLYVGSTSLTDLGYVVMDEVHYLGDRFRGAVWEEVIIHLPAAVRLVSLSATVSNAEEFGEWLVIGARRDAGDRPRAAAGPAVAAHARRHADVRPVRSATGTTAGRRPAAARRRSHPLPRPRSRDGEARGPGRGWRPPHRPDVIARLDREGLLPAITFIFSRAGCDAAVAAVRARGHVADRPRTSGTRSTASSTSSPPACRPRTSTSSATGSGATALRRGVAAHHAGLIPAFKETVEELFVRGLVRAVFATETLALGINMPARTRRARAADQVQRRDARRHHAGGVHPADRPGRTPRDRHRGPRRRRCGRRRSTRSGWPGWRPPARTRCGRRSGRPTTWRSTSSTRWAAPPPAICSSRPSPSSRPTASVAGLVKQIRRNDETLRRVRRADAVPPAATSPSTPTCAGGSSERETTLGPRAGPRPGAARWPRRWRRCAAGT